MTIVKLGAVKLGAVMLSWIHPERPSLYLKFFRNHGIERGVFTPSTRYSTRGHR